jgi:hypothetical protein
MIGGGGGDGGGIICGGGGGRACSPGIEEKERFIGDDRI